MAQQIRGLAVFAEFDLIPSTNMAAHSCLTLVLGDVILSFHLHKEPHKQMVNRLTSRKNIHKIKIKIKKQKCDRLSKGLTTTFFLPQEK